MYLYFMHWIEEREISYLFLYFGKWREVNYISVFHKTTFLLKIFFKAFVIKLNQELSIHIQGGKCKYQKEIFLLVFLIINSST